MNQSTLVARCIPLVVKATSRNFFPEGPVSGVWGIYNMPEIDNRLLFWADGCTDGLDLTYHVNPHLGNNSLIAPYPENPNRKSWNDHKVHEGFYNLYRHNKDRLREVVLGKFADTAKATSTPIIFAGHSVGAAVAAIAARDFVFHNPELASRIQIFTYACLRFCNKPYAESFIDKIPEGQIFRIINGSDFAAVRPSPIWGYRHIGSPIQIGNKGSLWNIWRYNYEDHFLSAYMKQLRKMIESA